VQLGSCYTNIKNVFYIDKQRITESLGLEGTSRDCIFRHLYSERGQLKQDAQDSVQSCLNTFKDGHSTTSLGNLGQCLTAFTVRKDFSYL